MSDDGLRYRIEDVALDGPRTPGEVRVSFVVPVRTVSGLNVREHHMARARRVARERDAVLFCWPRQPIPVPCVVSLWRRTPRKVWFLDDDNLRGALKCVRDELARLLGVDDRDPRVEWRYHQDVGDWGVYVLLQASAGGEILPELPRRRPAKAPRAKPKLQLLKRAQAQAGFRVTPNFIPPRKS